MFIVFVTEYFRHIFQCISAEILFYVCDIKSFACLVTGLLAEVFNVFIDNLSKNCCVFLFLSRYRPSAIKETRFPSSASASFFFLKDCPDSFPVGIEVVNLPTCSSFPYLCHKYLLAVFGVLELSDLKARSFKWFI